MCCKVAFHTESFPKVINVAPVPHLKPLTTGGEELEWGSGKRDETGTSGVETKRSGVQTVGMSGMREGSEEENGDGWNWGLGRKHGREKGSKKEKMRTEKRRSGLRIGGSSEGGNKGGREERKETLKEGRGRK